MKGRPPRRALLGALLAISAASTEAARADDASSIARGAKIVALGNGVGAYSCASCHGFDGVADPSGGFPRLAGLSAEYIRHELDAYADGRRRNTIMSHVSKAMTGAERADTAAYYGNARAAVPPAAAADPSVLALGDTIANVGLNDQQVPACVACHGPSGRSSSPATPSLAGQFSRYIAAQFAMFRSGDRKVGAGAMASIAHSLTSAQVRAVAAYFQRSEGGARTIEAASSDDGAAGAAMGPPPGSTATKSGDRR